MFCFRVTIAFCSLIMMSAYAMEQQLPDGSAMEMDIEEIKNTDQPEPYALENAKRFCPPFSTMEQQIVLAALVKRKRQEDANELPDAKRMLLEQAGQDTESEEIMQEAESVEQNPFVPHAGVSLYTTSTQTDETKIHPEDQGPAYWPYYNCNGISPELAGFCSHSNNWKNNCMFHGCYHR